MKAAKYKTGDLAELCGKVKVKLALGKSAIFQSILTRSSLVEQKGCLILTPRDTDMCTKFDGSYVPEININLCT